MPDFPDTPIPVLSTVAIGVLAMSGFGSGPFSLDSASGCHPEGEKVVGRYEVTRTMTSLSNVPVVEQRQVLSGPGIAHEYWLDEAIDSRELVPANLRSPAAAISKQGEGCNHAERFVHRAPNGDFQEVEWLVGDQMPQRYLSVTANLTEQWILQERNLASGDMDPAPARTPANIRHPRISIAASDSR